jgi:alpha-beta hydrolase superfamily lysophospholipase
MSVDTPQARPIGDTVSWQPPAAVNPRGTVVVLPGRGEHSGVYERFGLRIAADGYVVTTLPDPSAALPADTPAPLVLVGSDVGALHALIRADRDDRVAAVVAAGTPLSRGTVDADAGRDDKADWETEARMRTACPTHQARLTADERLDRGAVLTTEVPNELIAAAVTARPRVPVLFVHGAADPIARLEPVRALADELTQAALATVRDGRHDALNDITHRSVAAEIVQFLERVRDRPDAAPIVTIESAH